MLELTLHPRLHIIISILAFSCSIIFLVIAMRLIRRTAYLFRTITPEDYLFNQREALCAQTTRTTSLKPLPRANQGDIDLIDEIKLIGVPKGRSGEKSIDEIQAQTAQGVDLVYLQIDPSEYMARQRFMSHKCAMGKVEDYRLDGIELIDPHRPITWEETVVNLFVLDMLINNTLPQKTTYKNGLYAYSYPFLQDSPEIKNQLTPVFVDAISTHILGQNLSDYPLINKFLYTALMGRHKVMLGGMPDTLYKMILGKGLSIHELRDIFRSIILKNKQLTTPFSISKAAENFMPHIFLLPKDLYMTALLKDSFQAATQMVATVGIEHYRPIQEYWIGPPHGINLTEATKIPQGFPGETTEDLIEKQAILDVLLQSRTWSKPYLSNPFPYLFQDVSKISKEELDSCKQIFLQNYRKYSQFKNRQLKQIGGESLSGLLPDQSREELLKVSQTFSKGPKLSHLSKTMDIKIDRSIFDFFK